MVLDTLQQTAGRGGAGQQPAAAVFSNASCAATLLHPSAPMGRAQRERCPFRAWWASFGAWAWQSCPQRACAAQGALPAHCLSGTN